MPNTEPRAFSDADLAEVLDHPEWTELDFAHAKRFAELLPDSASAGAPEHSTTTQLTLEIDRDVVESFKSGGPDWKRRMNQALRKAAGL